VAKNQDYGIVTLQCAEMLLASHLELQKLLPGMVIGIISAWPGSPHPRAANHFKPRCGNVLPA
jgi:hypothetical protein